MTAPWPSSAPASATRRRPGCWPTSCRRHGRRAAARGVDVSVEVVDLREHAHDLANHLVTGFPRGAADGARRGRRRRRADRGHADLHRVLQRAVQVLLRRDRRGRAHRQAGAGRRDGRSRPGTRWPSSTPCARCSPTCARSSPDRGLRRLRGLGRSGGADGTWPTGSSGPPASSPTWSPAAGRRPAADPFADPRRRSRTCSPALDPGLRYRPGRSVAHLGREGGRAAALERLFPAVMIAMIAARSAAEGSPSRARSRRPRPAGWPPSGRFEDLDRIGVDQAGVLDPAGLGHLEQVAAQRLHVVGRRGPTSAGVQAAGQPGVLGGDAGRAGVGVALLRLDAADREHRLPGDVDHVAAEREGDDGVVGQPELARPDERTVLQAPPRRTPVDAGEARPGTAATPSR